MSRQTDIDELRRRIYEERRDMQEAIDRLEDRVEVLEKRGPFRKFVSKDSLMAGDKVLSYEGDGCYIVLRNSHYATAEPPSESPTAPTDKADE